MFEQLQNFDPAELSHLTPEKVVQTLFTLLAWCCLVVAYRGTKWAAKTVKARWKQSPAAPAELSEYATSVLAHLKDDGSWKRDSVGVETHYRKQVDGREVAFPKWHNKAEHAFTHLTIGGWNVAGSFKDKREIFEITVALAALQEKLEDRHRRAKLGLPPKPFEGKDVDVKADAQPHNPVRDAQPEKANAKPCEWHWSTPDRSYGPMRTMDFNPIGRVVLTRIDGVSGPDMGPGWYRLVTQALPGTAEFERLAAARVADAALLQSDRERPRPLVANNYR